MCNCAWLKHVSGLYRTWQAPTHTHTHTHTQVKLIMMANVGPYDSRPNRQPNVMTPLYLDFPLDPSHLHQHHQVYTLHGTQQFSLTERRRQGEEGGRWRFSFRPGESRSNFVPCCNLKFMQFLSTTEDSFFNNWFINRWSCLRRSGFAILLPCNPIWLIYIAWLFRIPAVLNFAAKMIWQQTGIEEENWSEPINLMYTSFPAAYNWKGSLCLKLRQRISKLIGRKWAAHELWIALAS